jgi:hypothetical protein
MSLNKLVVDSGVNRQRFRHCADFGKRINLALHGFIWSVLDGTE